MEKKQIITIAGKPGSGKSTTSKKVAEVLGYQHFSSGDFFRAIGNERGIDVLETNLVAEEEKDIDHLVDQKLRDLGAEEDNLVIDSRMAWHWMPYSFRVYLELDLLTAAERIMNKLDEERRHAEHIPATAEEYAEVLANRLASETKRYQDLYQVNPYNPENYDLVIDTESNEPDKVVATIVAEFKKWQSQ